MSDRALAFHSNPWQGVFYVTGGGSPFLAEMLSTPGASASVLEVNVPYAEPALVSLLGRTPEQAASDVTARQLAMAAFQRARTLAPSHDSLFGLGCTASLATNREKKGTHRAHWALQTSTETYGFSTTYSADRQQEEGELNDQLWASLQHLVAGHELPKGINLQTARPALDVTRLLEPAPSRVCTADHTAHLLLPGSFNPLHHGHRKMMQVAEAVTGQAGAYEITVRNADKPALDFISLEERLSAIAEHPVWLTNTPTYAGKAELFPGATFAIGVDTISRVGEVRFYDNREDLMAEAFDNFERFDCRFIVFGRTVDGVFQSLGDLHLPEQLAGRCQEVSEDIFREDVSSTALRN
ncbi:MAG: hypothetical protein GKR90_24200 [Pseudomonadales bacterium]|nr:hypothetical protein [Pseudomonadales bacterium]